MNRRIVLILFLFTAASSLISADEINMPGRILTDPLPPYNFQDENGTASGFSVDLLIAMFDAIGVSIDSKSVEFIPWARAMQITKTERGTILFSVARTEEREPLFRWVGPIGELNIGLIGAKDSGLSLDDFVSNDSYKVVVVRGSAPEQLFLASNCSEDCLIRVASPEQAARMLINGRAVAWAHVDGPGFELIKAEGGNAGDFEMFYALRTVELYYALNPADSQVLALRLNTVLDALKEPSAAGGGSFYQRLRNKYF